MRLIDADKVVERLEKLKTNDECDLDCPQEDISCCECTQHRILNIAIEIVKAGGIDAKN